ncbi:MAG: hypothetical protein GY781_08740 [Gammaproteobacteria bacterium]|nr:hypothetical protein [Gammaproteobacteria bacterium]
MSKVYQFPNKDEILDQASKWLAKLDRGLSVKEEAKLKIWLTDNPVNKQSLMDIAELWDKMDSLARLSDLFPKPAEQPESKIISLRTPLSLVTSVASITLISVLAIFWITLGFSDFADTAETAFETNLLQLETPSVPEQHYQTNIGEKSTIMLVDGSEVILNTNSSIRTHFTENERSLYLERGEIHVQVAHEKSRPFRVYVKDKMIQAVGTEFNLEIIDDQKIELIVTEGKVLVSVRKTDTRVPVMKKQVSNTTKQSSVENKTTLAMAEGEKMIIGSIKEVIEPIKAEEINVKLSWRGGNLIFRGESLENAITEIERYTQVEFEILDENLKQVRVAGLFKAGDVNGLLETLQQNFNVTHQKIGSDKILLSSKSP